MDRARNDYCRIVQAIVDTLAQTSKDFLTIYLDTSRGISIYR